MINRLTIDTVAWTLLGLPGVVHAQSVRAADSLLQSGAVARAESTYYAAARVRPHDPIARWALGRYLVGRGATRVGATLFEESLRFGGEAAIVGRDLAPVYLTIGEFGSLAALGSATPAERARAKWLVAHPLRTVASEPAVITAFRPSNDSSILGHVPLRIDGRTVDAVVTPRVHGIVVYDSALARRLHKFGVRDQGPRADLLAVADSVGIATLSIINSPVTISRLGDMHAAAIGLDLLGRYMATFDPHVNHITLRPGGSVAPSPMGQRFVTWTTISDLRIVQGGVWISVTRPPIAKLLREHRWTLDGRRGRLIVEP